MPPEITIETPGRADEELLEAVARLLPQLSETAAAPSLGELAEIVGSPSSSLFVARAGAEIVGMLTLVTYRIPTGLSGHIEDVVVDAERGGQGIGRLLVERALEEARRQGVRFVELTSRASREAANRLYQGCGFVIRDTNVYRFRMEAPRADPDASRAASQ